MKNLNEKLKNRKNIGFVILFAITLSSIFLTIALGVANIAYKEIKFSTSAKFTNEAFFAADSAIECALMNDKGEASVFTGGRTSINCLGGTIDVNGGGGSWNFIANEGGMENCAIVTITKTSGLNPTTNIISKGYNIGGATCASSNPDRVEREIEVNY